MKELCFKNTRFDPDLTPFHELAKDMAQAFWYTADLFIDKELAQLIRLRVAQYHHCSYCQILHTKTARDIGIPDYKVDHLNSWWESDIFSEEEKTIFSYSDSLSLGVDQDFQQKHDALTRYFSEKEIAEIAAIIINMNLWTRLKLAQWAVPTFKNNP